ncbi:MAG: response regulator, partial [Alphaproteobacteria bacterium]|nr:response regulator [Alphaproteobacteria bacterium]
AETLLERRPTALAEMEAALGDDADARAKIRRLAEGAATGAPFSIDLARRRADGGTDWWLVGARPLASRPGAVHWRVEDVTSRHEMEAVLREEQVKLVDFMDHAPVGFYSVDQEGRFQFANATLAEWLGCEPTELVRGTFALHDFLETPPEGAPPYALVADDEDVPTVDLAMKSRDGRVFQASIAQTVVEDGDGRVWTRSVVRDLTPERRMREALRASEARFQRFFDDAPIGIALVDADGRLNEWNQAFLKLIDKPAGDIQGASIAALVEERDHAALADRLSRVLAGERMDTPLEVHLSSAADRMVALFAKRFEGAGAAAPGLILQFIDQTERRNLEVQFAQSQKMQAVGQLAGGIAHDFNNLLTAMIGFCDLLLLRHKPGDASFGDIMQIKQNANRAANLVRQLLAFSRQQTLQPRILTVTDVLAELSNLLRRLIGENIELKMTHGRDLGPVRVDQGQLEQVIINLAVNARDAMAGGGRLTIATSNVTVDQARRVAGDEMPPGDYVAIEVVDSGHGIPPDIKDRIFDPFFSTKEVGSGTGLGLSTVYGIVRQTGGYVDVESQLGQGARFTIYLPRHHADATGAPASGDAAADAARDLTGAGCILLVEDEDPVRVFSARALRNKGYEVLEAKSGEEALGLMREAGPRIDLLVTDVVMPNMDGPTLIRTIRGDYPEMKVICISGYAEDKFRQRLDDARDVHFLPKPFSLKQLAAKVKDIIRV